MKTFAIVLSIFLVAGSSAFAQTEATPDTLSVLVEVWVASNLSSKIISAAGREDSCKAAGCDRYVWKKNSRGSIEFLFPFYNKQDGRFIEHYLPGLDYQRYLVCCLVLENSNDTPSIYPLEFYFSGPGGTRETSEGVYYLYTCFYLKGESAEIFYLSDNLQAQGREEDY
ncbi:MAG: hypothetical protein PHZ04_04375 [Patescibacteria group bacterium]|nr:hypothetical protein [Patescibacteria group bacterium]MDD5294654.1 hypothetical protein [Patescibacteria group bacterium]MDD5554498.1 hypothetical protein [Patescibacteria group bacterium]